MNATGPVLRDIHLPPAAWWPLAPGWWLLLAIVVVLGTIIAVWWTWRRRRGGLRAALREIDALEAAFANQHDTERLAEGASRLLRRVARVVDADAASASGDAWQAFLRRYARTPSTRNALASLVDVRYRARPSLDAPELLTALRAWSRVALGRGRARAAWLRRAPCKATP